MKCTWLELFGFALLLWLLVPIFALGILWMWAWGLPRTSRS